MESQLLRVDGLRVVLDNGAPVVDGVSFALERGRILALVGESGSGKTTLALALLGHARRGVNILEGEVTISGLSILRLRPEELRRVRGAVVAYVPQDPSVSLNPSSRIGDQLAEVARAHARDADVAASVVDALTRVSLPADRAFRRRFPHQLSGGQQQRALLAIALVANPALLVLDEPTTGLDVVTQARILVEIARLRDDLGVGIVYVSHNLAVVSSIADEIAVMYAGELVEWGPTTEVLEEPRHPYTAGLVTSVPDATAPRQLRGVPGVAPGVGRSRKGCAFAPRCELRVRRCESDRPQLELVGADRSTRCFRWAETPAVVLPEILTRQLGNNGAAPVLEICRLRAGYRARGSAVVAADDVSFSIDRGTTVALVGESGSGKTTIARCIVGLHEPWGGEIRLDMVSLSPLARDRSAEARKGIQIVFQNPYDSLNPKHRIGSAVAWPARLLRGLSRAAAEAEAEALLERVRLPRSVARRYPTELSGGERQRVAIARALAAQPRVLICDEITSALDVSVQAAALELLAELRTELGLSMLLVSHDLGVVASVADRILILNGGVICEEGPTMAVLGSPTEEYTRAIIDSTPKLVTHVTP